MSGNYDRIRMRADALTMRFRVMGNLSLKPKYESGSLTACHWMENMFDYEDFSEDEMNEDEIS